MSPSSASQSILAQFTDRAQKLHTLPAVALRVLDLTSEAEVDLAAVRECVERDPALTGRILKTVNSPLFGLSREICDLSQAVAILGTTPLKMLVLGFSLPKNLFVGIAADIQKEYWKHTLIKAVAARRLAADYFMTSGDEAYISGLLQGLGQLILIQELGDSYINFLDRVRQEDVDLTDMEVSTLGFDHATLSARMLDHWGLPKKVVRAVGQPFDEAAMASIVPQERQLPQILHLAELMARLLTYHRPSILKQLLCRGHDYQGLDTDQISELVRELSIEVPQLAQVYCVDIAEDYEDVLSRAHDRLVDLSAQAAVEIASGPSVQDDSGEVATALAADPTPEMSPSEFDMGLAASNSPPTAAGSAQSFSISAAVQQLNSSNGSELVVELEAPLSRSISMCRDARSPISLMMLEIARADDLVFQIGPGRFDQVLEQIRNVISEAAPTVSVLRVDDARFAVLFPKLDRADAVAITRWIVRSLSASPSAAGSADVPVGAGVATLACPPRNFPATELIEAAGRCLYGAHQCGGGVVKSIDL